MADVLTTTTTITHTNSAGTTTFMTFTMPASTSAPTQVRKAKIVAPLAAGDNDLQELTRFTALQGLIIKNNDAANFVTFTYTDNVGAGTARSVKIAAGEMFRLGSDLKVTVTPTITADTAAVECWMIAWGT